MSALPRPLVSAATLRAHLGEALLVILDVRSGADRRARYDAGHLPGASYVDLEADLSGDHTSPSVGGRHPLPSLDQLARTLGRLGVTPARHVVVYDDARGALAAARAWWMLRAVGHDAVSVLDGGLEAAVDAGIELTTEVPMIAAQPPYPVGEWQRPTVSIEEVDTIRSQPGWVLVDVRSAARFRGESEPIDPVAGHIEGAVNLPYELNLDADGRFESKEALAELYGRAFGQTPMEQVVVSCGSGVTACHTLLALEHAGLTGARLYVGSWSEWCRARGGAA